MPNTFVEIERQACALSAEGRARLALVLMQSLEGPDEGNVEEAWRVEIESRWAAIKRGEAETTPVSEVLAEVRRALMR
jgi:putative addiction module component (TIGR02574 family)